MPKNLTVMKLTRNNVESLIGKKVTFTTEDGNDAIVMDGRPRRLL